jgi:hypothetical protein
MYEAASGQKLRRALRSSESRYLADMLTSRPASPGDVLKSRLGITQAAC